MWACPPARRVSVAPVLIGREQILPPRVRRVKIRASPFAIYQILLNVSYPQYYNVLFIWQVINESGTIPAMATSSDFIEFVYDQVATATDSIRYRKMFGDYMVFSCDKPVLLVCDDTVYVKQIPDALAVFTAHGITPDAGIPYGGARPHYILDIENTDLAIEMVQTLTRVLPMPKPKKKKVASKLK